MLLGEFNIELTVPHSSPASNYNRTSNGEYTVRKYVRRKRATVVCGIVSTQEAPKLGKEIKKFSGAHDDPDEVRRRLKSAAGQISTAIGGGVGGLLI